MNTEITTPTAVEPRNGFGIAALICGITGFVAGFVPLFFFVAGTLGLIALVLGLVGRGKVKRGVATNGKVAMWGWITGILALIMATIGLVIVVQATNDLGNSLEEIGSDWDAYSECTEKLDYMSPSFDAEHDKCEALLDD